jgi:hypothetical protein
MCLTQRAILNGICRMHKFPSEFSEGIFFAKTLQMICVNANQVYFHFNTRLTICAESPFQYYDLAVHGYVKEVCLPFEDVSVLKLIEQKIIAASITEMQNLFITFENRIRLGFLALERYESYRVLYGKDEFII